MAVFLRSRASGVGFDFLETSRPPSSYQLHNNQLQHPLPTIKLKANLHPVHSHTPASSSSSAQPPARSHPRLAPHTPWPAAPITTRPAVTPAITPGMQLETARSGKKAECYVFPRCYCNNAWRTNGGTPLGCGFGRIEGRTTGTHLFRASSYSYSCPSSASRMSLLLIFENETRGSASNSSGSLGKEERRGGGDAEAFIFRFTLGKRRVYSGSVLELLEAKT